MAYPTAIIPTPASIPGCSGAASYCDELLLGRDRLLPFEVFSLIVELMPSTAAVEADFIGVLIMTFIS
jgi:hypothetical protein